MRFNGGQQAFYDSLADGYAIIQTILNGQLVAAKVSFAQIRPRIERPGIVGLLGQMDRPGVIWLTRFIEMHHFQPFTPASDLFEVFELAWVGLRWRLALFPYESVSPFLLRDAIDKAGLVGKAAAPAAVVTDRPPLGDGTVPSPQKDLFAKGFIEMDLPLERVLYLENKPGHLIYRDRSKAIREDYERMVALEKEWEACRFGR